MRTLLLRKRDEAHLFVFPTDHFLLEFPFKADVDAPKKMGFRILSSHQVFKPELKFSINSYKLYMI